MTHKMLKILMLEDVAEDVGLIDRALQKGNILFEGYGVDTKETFLDGINKFHPDVILSDHSLPQFNSVEALKICRNSGFQIPFILVTGTVSEEFAVMCLKGGADDYVLKSNLSRLPTAILNALKQRKYELHRMRAERALRKQNEKLTKANKELDNFIYCVSHNLRSPLASVLGLLNIARIDNKTKDAVIDRYLTMMEQSIRGLDETLKEIIDYSKNSNSDLAIKEINLKTIIENCLNKLCHLDGFDHVESRILVEQNAPLYSDEFRLSLVMNNLISNAIIFRDEHKAHPFVRISANIDSKNAIMRIEDNGIGISEDLQSKLFNMFFRASEQSTGPGLGLYIARETAEKLRGKIEMHSHPGVGTEVLVKIQNTDLVRAHQDPSAMGGTN